MGSQLMRTEVGDSIWIDTLLTMPTGAALEYTTCLSATLVNHSTYLLMAFADESRG